MNDDSGNDAIVENILSERYYQPGETSWDDIAKRVGNFVGKTEVERDEFYNVISTKKFIPNTPALINCGKQSPMLFACYALGADDSIDSIFDTMKVAATIMKMGGGIGVDWSHLRPEGTLVKSTHGTSSGVIAFMRNFDAVIDTVKSGGVRRGAGISLLDIEHGDIDNFITCKNEEGVFPNFNISVKVTDNFMNNIDDPCNVAKLDAIASAMWKRSEPGICFIDTAKKALVVPLESDEDIGLNPCGEQVLVYNRKMLAGECCNLGSINIAAFYDPVTNWINEKELERVVRIAVRYLDNSIDKSAYPTKNIEDMTKATRKIGLGEMGWADLFILMGIRYGSQESLDAIHLIKSLISRFARSESELLAAKNGSFPKFHLSSIITKRRNAAISTEAPTGTISLIADCSSGIEPVISYIVERKNSCGTGIIVHKQFDAQLQKIYPKNSSNYNVVIKHCLDHGSIQDCQLLPDEFKKVFVTALDITPKEHIDVQAEFQKYTDASISKTLNLAESTSVDDIKNIIKYAWESGLKGMTIYRQGSRSKIVYDINKSLKSKDDSNIEIITNPVKYKLVNANGRILPKTPRETPATMYKRNTGCGKMMIAIGEVDGKPHSITIVNKGGCDAMTQAVTELTSLCERYGVPQWNINKVLLNIRCSAALRNSNSDGKSCAHIIGKILNDFYPHDDEPSKEEIPCAITYPSELDKLIVPTHKSFDICPECGAELSFESGCVSCRSCGKYNRCS